MIASPLTRNDLDKLFPNNPKAVLAFEQLFRQIGTNTEAITAGTDTTELINDATVVTLSANNAFNNERVLAVDPATMRIEDKGNQVLLSAIAAVATTNGYTLTFNLPGDISVDLIDPGKLLTTGVGTYADDAAAAAAGVQVGDFYKKTPAVGTTVGMVAWRVT